MELNDLYSMIVVNHVFYYFIAYLLLVEIVDTLRGH